MHRMLVANHVRKSGSCSDITLGDFWAHATRSPHCNKVCRGVELVGGFSTRTRERLWTLDWYHGLDYGLGYELGFGQLYLTYCISCSLSLQYVPTVGICILQTGGREA